MHMERKTSFPTETMQFNKLYLVKGNEMVTLHFVKIFLSFYTQWLKFVSN